MHHNSIPFEQWMISPLVNIVSVSGPLRCAGSAKNRKMSVSIFRLDAMVETFEINYIIHEYLKSLSICNLSA